MRHSLPVEAEFKSSNTIIKKKLAEDGSGIDLFIIERKVMGVLPHHFMKHYEVMVHAAKCSRLCKKIDMIESGADEEGKVEVYASYVNSPTRMISGRMFIDAKYLWEKENIVIMTSEGNEKLKEQYCSSKTDLQDVTVAFCLISGHKYTPIFDEQDKSKVIGTHIIFVSESDFGGSIPKWIITKFAPPSLSEFYDDVIKQIKADN
jgi:hypothetical protein